MSALWSVPVTSRRLTLTVGMTPAEVDALAAALPALVAQADATTRAVLVRAGEQMERKRWWLRRPVVAGEGYVVVAKGEMGR